MTQYASAPQQYAASSAENFPAPNYGPFGTVPNAPGVVYFGEKWGSREGPTISIVLGSILMVIGVFVLIGGGVFFALCTMIIGASFIVIPLYNRKKTVHLDLICDAVGITVRRSNREQGVLPDIWVPWSTVSATHCTARSIQTQNTDNGTTTTTYVQEFAIDARGVPACQTDEKMTKGLPAFIDLCNRSAPHLGYRWIPKKAANGMPIMETVYKYAKVPLR